MTTQSKSTAREGHPHYVAFSKGAADALDGHARAANPYPAGSFAHDFWDRGWMDRQKDSFPAIPLAVKMQELTAPSRVSMDDVHWQRVCGHIRAVAERGFSFVSCADFEALMENAYNGAMESLCARLQDEGFEIVDGSISWQLAEPQPKDVDQEDSHDC